LARGQPVCPDDGPGRGRRLTGDGCCRLPRLDAVLGGDSEEREDVGVLRLVVAVPVAHIGIFEYAGAIAVGSSGGARGKSFDSHRCLRPLPAVDGSRLPSSTHKIQLDFLRLRIRLAYAQSHPPSAARLRRGGTLPLVHSRSARAASHSASRVAADQAARTGSGAAALRAHRTYDSRHGGGTGAAALRDAGDRFTARGG